ncbi:MAG TPA: SRPBCC family protein [Cyclobacteriaceae bacterium]|nr:SRPBCC family protein [Cyclobacteriaceae bacterium]
MNTLQARNEIIIGAPAGKIWDVITDIHVLHKVNPGVIKASGRMDIPGETRTCEIENNGKKGIMTEKLIELIPGKRTVWTIQSDTLGMARMLSETRFCFNLDKIDENNTRVVNETYYQPANFFVSVMNRLIIRKKITLAQEQILKNIKLLTEK